MSNVTVSGYADKIEWNTRFTDLKPSCFQQEKVNRAIGNTLLVLGVVLAAATIVTAFTFTATAAVILQTVSILACTTLVFLALGVVFRLLPNSWNDPEYRKTVAKKALEDIFKNQLSYKNIREKYGYEIDKYNILTQDDLKVILQDDVDKLSYAAFRSRHGVESLKLFKDDEVNKQTLRKKFLDFLIQPSWSYKTFLEKYQTESALIDVDVNDLIPSLMDDVNALDYSEFRSRHGVEAILLFRDNDAIKETLKKKFLEFFLKPEWSYKTLIREYQTESCLIGVSADDIAPYINQDVSKYSYQEFKQYHGLDCLSRPWGQSGKYVMTSQSDAYDMLKGKFISHLASLDLGVKKVGELYGEDCQLFDISPNQMAETIIFNRVLEVINGNVSYQKFREDNGVKSFSLLPKDLKEPLAQKFVEHVLSKKMGLNSVLNEYQDDLKVFNIEYPAIRDIVMPKQLDEMTDYLSLRSGNGWAAIEQYIAKNPQYISKLKSHFCRLPYHAMVASEYSKDRSGLNIRNEDIENAVWNDFEKMDYSAWVNTHSKAALDIFQGERRAKIQKVLNDFLTTGSKNQVFNYIEDCKKLNLFVSEILLQRWNNKTIMDILGSDEKEAFCRALDNKFFTPEGWRNKVLAETNLMSIETMLKTLKPIFSYKILEAYHIQDKLSNELSSLTSLDELIARYLDLYTYKLMSADLPGLKQLVKNSLKQKSIVDHPWNNDTALKKVKEWNWVDSSIDQVINKSRSTYESFLKNHETKMKDIVSTYEDDVKAANERCKQSQLSFERGLNMTSVEDRVRQAQRAVNECNANIDLCETRIRTVQNQISNLPDPKTQQSLVERYENEIRQMKAEIQSSQKRKETLESEKEGLEKQKTDLKNKIVTGFFAAKQVETEISDVESKIESKRTEIEGLKKVPNGLQDLENKLRKAQAGTGDHTAEKKSLEDQLSKYKSELRNLKLSKIDPQGKLDIVESELKRLKDELYHKNRFYQEVCTKDCRIAEETRSNASERETRRWKNEREGIDSNFHHNLN